MLEKRPGKYTQGTASDALTKAWSRGDSSKHPLTGLAGAALLLDHPLSGHAPPQRNQVQGGELGARAVEMEERHLEYELDRLSALADHHEVLGRVRRVEERRHAYKTATQRAQADKASEAAAHPRAP